MFESSLVIPRLEQRAWPPSTAVVSPLSLLCPSPTLSTSTPSMGSRWRGVSFYKKRVSMGFQRSSDFVVVQNGTLTWLSMWIKFLTYKGSLGLSWNFIVYSLSHGELKIEFSHVCVQRFTGASGQQSALRDLLFACCAGESLLDFLQELFTR